jgi:hypothetical protein
LLWMERTVSKLQFLSTFSFPLSALHEISFKIILICSAWIHFPRVTEFLVLKERSDVVCKGFGLSVLQHCISCRSYWSSIERGSTWWFSMTNWGVRTEIQSDSKLL